VPASWQSRHGLDWTNFFVGDMQTGFGAVVAFYLSSLGWSEERVGLALTVDGLAAVIGQIPGGALADALRWKRALAAASILATAAAALVLALVPVPLFVYAAQALHGLAAGVLTAAVASITLGLVGRATTSFRVGRNYRFSAAGNALTAGAMAAAGRMVAPWSMFLAAGSLCIPALTALSFIRPNEIDYARSRNAGTGEAATNVGHVLDLRANRNLLVLAAAVVLFQLADAAMLPAIEVHLGRTGAEQQIIMMSVLIVIPQAITALLAPWVGYYSERIGRKPLLLAGFAAQILRGCLLAYSDHGWALVASQLLDGVSGAAIGVLTFLVVADVTTGTGRFNLARGAVGTLSSLAASVSTGVAGLVIQMFGLSAGFMSMAAVAAACTLVTWTFLPETKPSKYLD
jgi:MFS family permease